MRTTNVIRRLRSYRVPSVPYTLSFSLYTSGGRWKEREKEREREGERKNEKKGRKRNRILEKILFISDVARPLDRGEHNLITRRNRLLQLKQLACVSQCVHDARAPSQDICFPNERLTQWLAFSAAAGKLAGSNPHCDRSNLSFLSNVNLFLATKLYGGRYEGWRRGINERENNDSKNIFNALGISQNREQ